MTYDPATGNGTITIGSEVDTLISVDSFNAGRLLSGGFEGTDFADVIVGTSDSENDVFYGLFGRGGNDTISGGAGDDKIFGDEGNDVVNGDTGNDELYGGNGNDSTNGGTGDDTLVSDLGNDTINGGTGFDYYRADYRDRTTGLVMTYDPATGNGTITIGSEVDTLISVDSFNAGRLLSGGFEGTDFADVIVGTSDSENYVFYGLFGRGGNDTISGGAGDDKIFGDEGNDVVNGDTGNDKLYGGNGNDILQGTNGGAGDRDSLEGGLGADRFILGDSTWIGYDDGLTNNAGTNDYAEIADFNSSENDVIQLRGGTNYRLSIVGADTQLLIDKPNTEPDELIAIIKNRTGLSLSATYFAYNQSLPSVTLAVSPASVSEDGTPNLIYTFTRTGATTNPLTVNYSINGTATATDYTGATPGTGKTITFAAGAATATLTIDPTADTTVESDETVALTLAAGTGYTLGTTTAVTGTITNDDIQSSLAFSYANFFMGENGLSYFPVSVTRTGNLSGVVSATVNLSNGTATAPADYNNLPIVVNFAASETTKTVNIPIVDDLVFEPTETINLTLTNPTGGATLGSQSTSVLNLIDNDPQSSILSFSAANFSVNENGTPVSAITINRTGTTIGSVSATVDFLFGGTATPTTDFNANPVVVNFASGETSKTVSIPIVNDILFEGNETIRLVLTDATGATIGGLSKSTLTILSDDALNGTANNDTLLGSADNDTINGLDGNDNLTGGAGNDTLNGGNGIDQVVESADVNFTLTNTSLTGIGTDVLSSIEGATLTGGTGNNTLNASAFTLGAVTLNGGAGQDTLVGGSKNDTLLGGDGNDQLTGAGTGNGIASQDTLTGGNGIDTFILGNSTVVFYNDGNLGNAGFNDYALITDFNSTQDKIQLKGAASLYLLGTSPVSGVAGTAIYLNTDGVTGLGATDELIGIVQGSSLNLTATHFTYV